MTKPTFVSGRREHAVLLRRRPRLPARLRRGQLGHRPQGPEQTLLLCHVLGRPRPAEHRDDGLRPDRRRLQHAALALPRGDERRARPVPLRRRQLARDHRPYDRGARRGASGRPVRRGLDLVEPVGERRPVSRARRQKCCVRRCKTHKKVGLKDQGNQPNGPHDEEASQCFL